MSAEKETSGAVGCGCIAHVDAQLAAGGYNTVICTNLFGMPKALIETTQLKTGRGQKKATKMFASFCPFCGAPYSSSVSETAPIQESATAASSSAPTDATRLSASPATPSTTRGEEQ